MGFSASGLQMFLLILSVSNLALHCNGDNSSASCIKNERDALLKFKQGLLDPSNRLSSWVGEDCCAWEGVGCSNTTGHVRKLNLHNPSSCYYVPAITFCDSSCLGGEISFSLANLTHLEYLDLSMNNFSNAEIPKSLAFLKSLKYLNLGFAELAGKVPHDFAKLSNLQYLDLRGNPLTITNLTFVSSLSFLKHLDLSGLDLSNVTNWLDSINMIPSLLELRLSNCGLSHIPNLIIHINFTSLAVLDLAYNNFNSTIPRWLFNISSMKNLDLSSNAFQGSIPSEIGNYNLLTFLDLSKNELDGPLPVSIGKLSNLTELYITHSSLDGTIPESIGQLSKLETLDLHKNFLEGLISERHFSNLTSLDALFLDNALLVVDIDPTWVPPFQLSWISMSSCKVGPDFPQWLRTQTTIFRIDMSNASISDSIPDWFHNISLNIHDLDLSYNQITKDLPKLKTLSFGDLYREIYLDSNKFEGSLPPFPSDVAVFDVSNNLISGRIPQTLGNVPHMKELFLSNNRLSGIIPSSLCNLQSLNFLVLANNQLSGRLPKCWEKLQSLYVIDLANNNLGGRIPLSLSSVQGLVSLHLENNNFNGKIPKSFKKLTSLRALDLSGNAFSGTIPPWIGENLSSLKILNLHSNMIYGEIPPQLCHLDSLCLLDLGKNQMTGAIPHCFGNFSAMILNGTKSEGAWSQYYYPYTNYPHVEYDEHTLAYMKGTGLEYTRTLQFLFSIDLSENHFSAEIPEEIMSLSKLQNLNLSGNNLVGHIPSNIGNLKSLESLDLSRNEFSGFIPSSISVLNFLSHLNLSFNNLSGRIPSGNQIQTLDDKSIYMGNNGLCGFPLNSCSEGPHKQVNIMTIANDESEKLWFFCGLAMGFIAGFVGVCTTLYFNDSWRGRI